MAQGSLRWLGHAFFEFVTGEGKTILIDPWTKDDGNPTCPLGTAEIEKADLILASHDHFDHIGSALDIAARTEARVGAAVESLRRLVEQGLDQDQAMNGGMGFNPGGGADLGWVKVVATQAFHSSDSGAPLGFIIKAQDGTTVYHAGDTGIFADMELFGRLYPLDAAILPMGGVFTMDAFQAAQATALLKPKMVVPMHFGSFPVIAPNADEFVKLCAEAAPKTQVRVLKPGESVDLG